MTDVNQVRINELARELEVKAKAIIDLLPGYGVTEKKTHSSSIPADVAEKVRKNILGHAEEEAKAEAAAKAEKEAKEADAKAARMRPPAPPPSQTRLHRWLPLRRKLSRKHQLLRLRLPRRRNLPHHLPLRERQFVRHRLR